MHTCNILATYLGVSRSWHSRKYVRNVGLVVIDEIHLLGEDRGNSKDHICIHHICIYDHICSNSRTISAFKQMTLAYLHVHTCIQARKQMTLFVSR